MKNNTFLRTSAGVVALFFAIAPLAYAEVSGQGTAGASLRATDIEVGADGKAVVMPVKMEDGMDMDMDVHGQGEMHTMESGMKMEGGMMEMEKATGTANAKMHADEHAEEGLLNAEMHINVAKLMKSEADEEHAKDEVEIDEAADVHSSVDFEHFVAHKAKSDARLKMVDIKDGKVEVTYALPVKFFGFWGTTLNTSASVDASGALKVYYPWYAVFMSKHFSKATLEGMFKNALVTKVEINQSTSTTAAVNVKAGTSLDIPSLFEMLATSFSVAAQEEISAK